MRPGIEENVPLASWTTLGVGGPARFFAQADDETELRSLVAFAREGEHPLLVLGGGSNLLVADRGFSGLVVRQRGRGMRAEESSGRVTLTVEAGHEWDDLVAVTVERGWAGIECLSGIPGQVGAAPLQNIGAYGQEIGDCLRSVRVLDVEDGRVREIDAPDCGLSYRTSHFKTKWRGRFAITGLTLELEPGADPTVRYPELRRALADRAAAAVPTLAEARETTLAIRRSKSMLLEESDPNRRSAGSFFTNPIVDAAVADEAAARAERVRPGSIMPRFPQDDGRVKLSAAWLMEGAGLARGHRRGPAGLSTHHVLALVNRGGAQATDLVELAMDVKRAVADTFGIDLSPEPVLVGFDPEAVAALTG